MQVCQLDYSFPRAVYAYINHMEISLSKYGLHGDLFIIVHRDNTRGHGEHDYTIQLVKMSIT